MRVLIVDDEPIVRRLHETSLTAWGYQVISASSGEQAWEIFQRDDSKRLGRPRGFTITVRDAALSAGAGFVVAYAGDILTMPGLPKVPGAEEIDIDERGNVVGLF